MAHTGGVLLAYAVAVLHAAAVLLMVTGGLLALRRPLLLLVHVPVALAILAVNLLGADCPLTRLELGLRAGSGSEVYSGGFLDHYVVQPLGLDIASTAVHVGIYTVAVLPNAVAVALLAHRLAAARCGDGTGRCERKRGARTRGRDG